jgi:uncharacterized protein YecE (DUF72 family)
VVSLHRIGTAGWTVPSQYAGTVRPGGSQLERYAQHLNATEINSSFHKPHQRKTYERWASSTPAGFRFSVKLPKTITHEARLADCGALLDRFVEEVTGLGEKLEILLVQLPPKLVFEERIADRFFHDLRARMDIPIALEPRHASWFTPDMDVWLAQRRIARVAADPARLKGAEKTGGWTGLAYYRWHGSPRIYFSDYEAAALASLKRRMDADGAHGVPAWCIFDNTASGAALGNALALVSLDARQP